MNDVQGMCGKCIHRKSCKAPCAFVDEILKEGNPGTYEQRDKGQQGQNITVLYPRWNEIHESVLRRTDVSGDTNDNKVEAAFSTLAPSPFLSYSPKLQRTTVFVEHFFKGQSYADIADFFGVTPEQIRSIYREAKGRVLTALQVLDARSEIRNDVEIRLKASEKASGKLPRTQRWLLLNKVFGMLPKEIAEMDGVTVKTVCGRIKDTYDRVITGQVVFMDPTEDEVAEANQRIEKKRARDRLGWSKRKARVAA